MNLPELKTNQKIGLYVKQRAKELKREKPTLYTIKFMITTYPNFYEKHLKNQQKKKKKLKSKKKKKTTKKTEFEKTFIHPKKRTVTDSIPSLESDLDASSSSNTSHNKEKINQRYYFISMFFFVI